MVPESEMITFVARDVVPWEVQVIALETQRCVLVHSILPQVVEPDSVPVVAELLTYLNNGMVLGNFELDAVSGTVRFKTSMPVGEALDIPALGVLVDLNVEMMTGYLPTIVSVAHGLPLEVAVDMSDDPTNMRSTG